MKNIRSICVYCGSSMLAADIYKNTARDLGKLLADNAIRLVYGGGRRGLMGIVADSTLNNGGSVLGFIPQYLDRIEGAHTEVTELHIVDTMHTRKRKMSEAADAFVILPGGFGTLDEFFEILTWKQIDMHDKPIILMNINNYWDPLISLIVNTISEKFADEGDTNLYSVVHSLDEILPVLLKSPEPKLEFASHWV